MYCAREFDETCHTIDQTRRRRPGLAARNLGSGKRSSLGRGPGDGPGVGRRKLAAESRQSEASGRRPAATEPSVGGQVVRETEPPDQAARARARARVSGQLGSWIRVWSHQNQQRCDNWLGLMSAGTPFKASR